MACRRGSEPSRGLLGGRAGYAHSHPPVHLHGDHAPALEDRGGSAGHHGPALRADPGRPGHFGGLRGALLAATTGHRRRDRCGHGADLAPRDAPEQLLPVACHRHDRGLGHAGPDHPALDRSDHPRRPAGLRRRSGLDRPEGAPQGSDGRAVDARRLRRDLHQRGRDVPRGLHPGPRPCGALHALHPRLCLHPAEGGTGGALRRRMERAVLGAGLPHSRAAAGAHLPGPRLHHLGHRHGEPGGCHRRGGRARHGGLPAEGGDAVCLCPRDHCDHRAHHSRVRAFLVRDEHQAAERDGR